MSPKPAPSCLVLHPEVKLDSVVQELCEENRGLLAQMQANQHGQPLPSRDEVVAAFHELRCVLFPRHFGPSEVTPHTMGFHIGATLHRVAGRLQEQVRRGLCFVCSQDRVCRDCDSMAQHMTRDFLARLPAVRRLLAEDVKAAYQGDPAARSESETLYCYPGVHAMIAHRLAHELHGLGAPLIPRIINEHAHSVTGIDIHPGARIGPGFFIDHGTGVVIGETAVIGRDVRIYQGVTLGARSFPLDEDGQPIKGVPRHPIVEDGVTVYAGATLLGRITVGRGSVIGGNVWLTRSVPAGSVVTQARARAEHFEGGAGI